MATADDPKVRVTIEVVESDSYSSAVLARAHVEELAVDGAGISGEKGATLDPRGAHAQIVAALVRCTGAAEGRVREHLERREGDGQAKAEDREAAARAAVAETV